jgi:hypothetical protein
MRKFLTVMSVGWMLWLGAALWVSHTRQLPSYPLPQDMLIQSDYQQCETKGQGPIVPQKYRAPGHEYERKPDIA